jgi:hypothetical protein
MTHIEVLSQVQAMPMKKNHSQKILAAVKKNNVDGTILSSIHDKGGLKAIKGLNVGSRTEFWRVLKPFQALPIETSLYQVLAKSLSKDKRQRYQTAKETMAALGSILESEAAKGMDLIEKIPTTVDEAMDEASKNRIMKNVGNAMLNHGYFTAAVRHYEDQMATAAYDVSGYIGAALSACMGQAWGSEESCSLLCDVGLEGVMKKFVKEVAVERSSIACAQSLSVMMVMCHSNAEHTKMVVENETLMKALPRILDDCCRSSHDRVFVGALCVGLCFCLSTGNRDKLINLGVVDKMPCLLQAHPAHPHLVGMIASLMRYLAVEDVELVGNGTVEALVNSWREHHTQDAKASHMVLNGLFHFTCAQGHSTKLRDLGVVELVLVCLKTHDTAMGVQAAGQKLLWKLADTKARARRLLKAGIGDFDADGVLPLRDVAKRGDVELVKLLLRGGLAVDKADGDGKAALFCAVEGNHVEVVKLLLDAGADTEKLWEFGPGDWLTILWSAAFEGFTDVVKLLLRAGADKDRTADDGVTPLFMAAQDGHADVVKLLLDAGADRDKADNNGTTPLFMAAQQGHADVVKLLLDAGADRDW